MKHLARNEATDDRYLIFHPFSQQHTASLRDDLLHFAFSLHLNPEKLIGIHLQSTLGFNLLPNHFLIPGSRKKDTRWKIILDQTHKIIFENDLLSQNPCWFILDMNWLNQTTDPIFEQIRFIEGIKEHPDLHQHHFVFHFNLATISHCIIHQSLPLYPDLIWKNIFTKNNFYLHQMDNSESFDITNWLNQITDLFSENNHDKHDAVFFHHAYQNFPHPILEADYTEIMQALTDLKQAFPTTWQTVLEQDLQLIHGLVSKFHIVHANATALKWLEVDSEEDFFQALPESPSHLFISSFHEHIRQLAEGIFPVTLALDLISFCDKDIRIALDIMPMMNGKNHHMLMIAHKSSDHMMKDLLESSLYKISQLVHTQRDLDSLYQGIHRILNQFVNAKNLFIALYDEDNQNINFSYHVDELDHFPDHVSVRRGKTEYVLQTGQTLWVDEQSDAENIQKGKYIQIGPPASYWLGVPLIAKDKTIGVIVIQTYDGTPLTEYEKFVMEFCSAQIALAIERKTADKRLQQNQQELSQILLGSSVPTRVLDKNKITTHFNRAYENFSGMAANEIMGSEKHPWISTHHPEQIPLTAIIAAGASAELIQSIYGNSVSPFPLIEGAFIYENLQIRTGNGEYWVNLTAAPLKDLSGNTIGAIENILDMTQRIDAEDEIRTFKTVADYANIGMFIANMHKEIVYINSYLATKLGYLPSDLFMQPISSIFQKNSNLLDDLMDEMVQSKKELRDIKITMQSAQKEDIPFLINAVKIETQHNQKSLISFSCFNMSNQKQREEALNRYANRLEILHKIDEAILEATSTDEIIKNALHIVLQLVKYTHASIIELHDEQTINIYHAVHENGKYSEEIYMEQFCSPQMMKKLLEYEIFISQDIEKISEEFAITLHDKNDHIHSCMIIPLIVKHEIIGRLLVGFSHSDALSYEISEIIKEVSKMISIGIHQTRLYEKIETMATIDGLTGIYNRRQLIELGEKALAQVKRMQRSLSVIVFDIDHFKNVNDTYGHTAGDKVLKAVVKRCLGAVRQIDVLGRYGGDEFVLILPETSIEKAEQVAIRLKECVFDEDFRLDEQSISISISVGISTLFNYEDNLTKLINQADSAMYDAKKSGRNRIILKK